MKSATRDLCARISWPAALMIVALIAAALIAFIFLRLESWPARTTHQTTDELERVGRDLRDAFVDLAHLQPRITINNRVYVERTRELAELALMSRQIEVEHEMLHTWAGSTKRVQLHGTFAVKAGFDLQKDVAVDLGENEITVRLPHARILGLEQVNVDVLAFDNGLWNRISADDVQTELATLPQLARAKAEQSGLPIAAEQVLQKQLRERLHSGRPIRLIFGDAPAKP
ncbi:MAG TPA: DUF4230 domain-containing protein [Chthoniobacterales bacterium]|nr:DUF4230 domain-containing protein [Chthoniobacterales bacterium]